jgi:hypothetical protein
MNHRLTLTLGVAAGGLLSSAFLPVGIAFAGTDGGAGAAAGAAAGTATDAATFPAAPGKDAFDIDSFRFDPFAGTGDTEKEGFGPLTQEPVFRRSLRPAAQVTKHSRSTASRPFPLIPPPPVSRTSGLCTPPRT